MDKLNLNELLRYGFAGALFLISLVSSFKEAQEIISKLPSDFFGATTVLGVVLVGGSLLYAVHRAVLYPIIYQLQSMVVYRNKYVDTQKLDALRNWMLLDGSVSKIQNLFSIGLGNGGSQVHFLYCSLWAITLSLTLGAILEWSPTDIKILSLILLPIIGVSALISHYRFLRFEKSLFSDKSG